MENSNQRILRQFLCASELCDTILDVLDQAEIDSHSADRMANMLIGLREHCQTSMDSIQTDDLASFTSGQAEISPDGRITLPAQASTMLDWTENDRISWSISPDGTVRVEKTGDW
jgi:hypothetical protein